MLAPCPVCGEAHRERVCPGDKVLAAMLEAQQALQSCAELFDDLGGDIDQEWASLPAFVVAVERKLDAALPTPPPAAVSAAKAAPDLLAAADRLREAATQLRSALYAAPEDLLLRLQVEYLPFQAAIAAKAADLGVAIAVYSAARRGGREDGGCYDCGEAYGSPRFPDLIIPLDIWKRISPTGDEGGVLCPNCICARLQSAGIEECPAAFMSGPIRTVNRDLMEMLRKVENLAAAAYDAARRGGGE